MTRIFADKEERHRCIVATFVLVIRVHPRSIGIEPFIRLNLFRTIEFGKSIIRIASHNHDGRLEHFPGKMHLRIAVVQLGWGC
jgi:hypothetical protein